MRAELQEISSVDSLPEQYKGILLDQFGVLHDGKTAYPNAVAAVEKLAKSGRKLVILSNSSRRSSQTIPKLRKLGFDESHFASAITSGEITFRCLRDRPDGWWQNLGRKCIHISWGARGRVSLAGLDLEVVLDPAEADFVVAHGTEVLSQGDDKETIAADLDEIKAVLEKAAARKLPLIVANPDVVTVSGDSLVPMPGTFAQWYRGFGGEVRLMGKPDPVIYAAAMELTHLGPDQVLAIGDSLEHDISGANAAGIDSAFVAGGIHKEELGISHTNLKADEAALKKLLGDHKAQPQFIIPFLR